MSHFAIHTVDTAPAASKDNVQAIQKSYGMLPNLVASFSGSSAALQAYVDLESAWNATSFRPANKQLLLVAVSIDNGCTYCTAAHSAMAKMSGAKDDVLNAVRSGLPTGDDRLDALLAYARTVNHNRGRTSIGALDAFIAAGFTETQALEVAVGVAFKALTNTLHAITEVALDAPFQGFAWQPAPEAK